MIMTELPLRFLSRVLRQAALCAGLTVALCLRPASGSDAEPGPDPVRLSLEALPNFVFADDRVQLVAAVSLGQERPKRIMQAPAMRTANVSLENEGRTISQEIPVSPYSDRPTAAVWAVDGRRLSHRGELVFRAALRDEKAAELLAGVVILCVDQRCEGVRIAGDHFEDAKGRRILFVIPRADEAAHRRWLPLRVVRGFAPGRNKPFWSAVVSATANTRKRSAAAGPRTGAR